MRRVENAMRASERVQGKTEYEEYSIPMALLQLQVFLEKKLLVVCELNYEGAVEHFLKPLGEVEGDGVAQMQSLAGGTCAPGEHPHTTQAPSIRQSIAYIIKRNHTQDCRHEMNTEV